MDFSTLLEGAIGDTFDEHLKPGKQLLAHTTTIINAQSAYPEDLETLQRTVLMVIEVVTNRAAEIFVADLLGVTNRRTASEIADLKKRLSDDADAALRPFQIEAGEKLMALITNRPKLRAGNPEQHQGELAYRIGVIMATLHDVETDAIIEIRKKVLVDYPALANR